MKTCKAKSPRSRKSRIPDLVERVVYDSASGVSQASVFPAQNYGNVSREGLLCAVDAINNT